ncbi:MAG: DUF1249 domain-containing protein [Sinobacteraceae bacterium]|nr:DUF1249 domain-containing protein [Nevskiaceae bacterium]
MIATRTKPFEASWNGQTHRLARIIDLYERNYRLLQRLTPELGYPFDAAVSRAGNEPPLYLMVVKRSRYTVELRLHYRFAGEQGDARPDMRLRVCRDAGTVEALGDPPQQCWPFVDTEVQDASHFLFQQWRRNHFLARWLEYLVDRGHGFALADRPREIAGQAHD